MKVLKGIRTTGKKNNFISDFIFHSSDYLFNVGGPNPPKTKHDYDYIYSMDTDVRSEKKRPFRPIQQWLQSRVPPALERHRRPPINHAETPA